MNYFRLFSSALTVLAATACVAPAVHTELQTRAEVLQTENNALRTQSDVLQVRLTETQSNLRSAQQLATTLQEDTARLASDVRKTRRSLTDLEANFDYLTKNKDRLSSANLNETKAMLVRMERLQSELEQKEEALKAEQARLEEVAVALQSRERRVVELESEIARKDSLVQYVQKSVADALLGFQGQGLTVSLKNGKVYVSMDNSLLFNSGSWTVQDKGRLALERLAKVLASNKDVRIEVEGHTDNDAYRGAGQVLDNWDLSVMRATAVTKILTGKGVGAARVSAVGRGEFQPLVPNETPENKAKNRRTEIIISPRLDALANLVQPSAPKK
ncbi:MAG: OmpA family protein [Schleiferiaceae bacterium]|jgi:chemotaxis protein MotB|nr:OmpA family protein [Schleiferiaceae bacterium]MDP4626568.1 OmpA family protein [Schleiferiaceae bacterium]MDP4728649.1 OmpA family protein [Schleiferiaceae bacterium]MDP4749634.1 OmpA family protein [Schleiferiaceae bacterium]MDP4859677.1 OmpA family protein [Schleiferiaceae bacterium]